MNSPFEVLMALEERASVQNQTLPSIENTQTHWHGLGISLLGQRFVIPMPELSELMRVPQATGLPGVQDFVLGIANVRGRLMALIDLAVFFKHENPSPQEQRRALAVEGFEQYFGFVVDESLGMQHFLQENFEKSVQVDVMFAPYVEGAYEAAGVIWPVMSLQRLATASRLERLAQ